MQNIQKIINLCGCNKYTINHVGKFDEHNYVIVHTDTHKNGKLMTKSAFLHNSKPLTLKFNENKSREKNKRLLTCK